MARDERPSPTSGAEDRAGRPVFDITAASQARMNDYLLGGCFP